MSASNAAYHQTEDEAARVAAALRDMGVVHRGRGARPAPPPEPDEPFLRLYDNPTPEQLALPAPYGELVNVANKVIRFVLDTAAQAIAEESERVDKKFVALEATIGELRGEIADLAHQLEMQKASRGHTDGRSLPPSLVQRKARAATKRSGS
jgi:hypothetical protein